MNQRLTICFFGSYDPTYSRNRVLLRGLRAHNAEVFEIHTQTKGWLRFPILVWKYLRNRRPFDIMIVGFPGQEIMFLARVLTRQPIIFDAFTSHYGGYILDRKYFSTSSWRAKYYRFLDTWSCRLADLVLLDTNAHIKFFVKEFGIPVSMFRCLFVGTDTSVFKPAERATAQDFVVHFHGSYIPLQGVEYIVQAAKLLEDIPVRFQLIGRGQVYQRIVDMIRGLGLHNIQRIDPVPYQELPMHIANADICLGIFGNTPKTDLVIPNKVFEALAMCRPVLTARTSAITELLTENDGVMLCEPANAQDLADKIRLLYEAPDLRERLARRGHEVLMLRASESVLGGMLIGYARELLQSKKS